MDRLLSISLLVFVGFVGSASAAKTRTAAAPKAGLHVRCSVNGAVVKLDGKPVGSTPLPPRKVLAGSHTVSVKKPGFAEFTQKVVVKPGDLQTLDVELVPYAAVLKVTADAPKAKVYIDGEPVGCAPLEYLLLPGTYLVTVSAPGLVDFTQDVQAEIGKQYSITAVLPKSSLAPGSDPLASMPLPELIAPGEFEAPPADFDLETVRPKGGPTELDPFAPLATFDPAGAGLGTTVEPPKRWYTTWWFWSAAGAVVVGSVAATLYILHERDEPNRRPADLTITLSIL